MFGTSFSRIAIVLVALVSFSQVVLAKKGKDKKELCADWEFWWSDIEVCLPYGGLGWTPSSPKNKSCPKSGWYWHPDNECCVPHQPSPPTPTCGSGWGWSGDEKCCKPQQPHKPQPSGHYNKKQRRARSTTLCPSGLTACPVGSLSGGDYECLDTTAELESCGGCTSKSEGQDCTAIKGAWNVGCDAGKCKIYTCSAGFKLSPNGKSCVPLL